MELVKPEFTELTFQHHVLTRRQDQCTWYVYARNYRTTEGHPLVVGTFETYEAAVLFTMNYCKQP